MPAELAALMVSRCSSASSPLLDPTSDLTAALTGRHTIERELGAGGMTFLHLAQDLKHDRKAASKVLRPGLAVVLSVEAREVR